MGTERETQFLTYRDKPNLLFFDLTQCITILSFEELVNGDLSGVFTCPTVQVRYLHCVVVVLAVFCVFQHSCTTIAKIHSVGHNML